jgi:fucose permease
MQARSDSTRRRTGLLVGLSYAAFVSLGLPDGLTGVGWPSIRQTFGLPIDALGAMLVVFTAGYLTSSMMSGRALERLGVGMLLVLSCAATAASLLVYGLAPSWWLMVGFAALSGLGAGAIDAGLNTYAAKHFDARTVNWLHACFGVGSATGPAIMTSVLTSGHSWRLGYLIVGCAQLALAACFAWTRASWLAGPADAHAAPVRSAPARATLRLPAAWLGIALFFIYTGLEMSAGQWMFSLLTESRGMPTALAGTCVSIYWASLTAGRIIFGIIAPRVEVERALLLCMVAIAIGAALVWTDLASGMSMIGFALMGLCLAPVFPSLISTTPNRLGPEHVPNAVGFQVGAAALGGSLLPGLVGVAAERVGLEVVGPALLAASLVLLVLFAARPRTGGRAGAQL